MNSAVKLKAGEVTRIRVNPTDALRVLDLLDRVGIDYRGQNMSFAQCVSLALSSLLQSAQNSGIIPETDTFQYLNRMTPFRGHASQANKLALAGAIGQLGANFQAPTVTGVEYLTGGPTSTGSERFTVERSLPQANEAASVQRAAREPTQAERQRLTELCTKQDLADSGRADWSQRDQEEYEELVKVIYPNG